MLESAISHKAENQLRKFLLKHKNNAEVQDRLDSIIRTLDYKIEKATIAYNKILQYDITELKELVKDVCASNKISCRKKRLILKKMKDCDEIFPIFGISLLDVIKKQKEYFNKDTTIYDKVINFFLIYEDSKKSIENIVKRLLVLHERAQICIKTRLDMNDFELLGEYNKRIEILILLKLLLKIRK